MYRKCPGVFFTFSASSSQSKPAKNTGICSVLTRQHVKQKHGVLKQFFTFFSSCSSIQKTLIFGSVFATAHPDSRSCYC